MANTPIERLFREHNQELVRFLRARLNNESDALEAAQEAYARLLQLGEDNQPSFLRAYLFKVAANVATDLLRKRVTRGPVSAPDEESHGDEATQEVGLSARQQLGLVAIALAELPQRCRDAFTLSRYEGLSTVEIAARLNVSDRMVRLYLVRSLEHIELVLARSEIRA